MAITAEQAIKAIHNAKGFITTAAKHLGISRTQLHRIINKYPTVREAVTDAKEEFKDFAESKIYQEISNGNTAILIFYAKTQMKDRGYVERAQVEIVQRELDSALDLLQKELPPETYDRILEIFANTG